MHLLAKKTLKYALMHLFQKSPKYAFTYASMQMHNYPNPSNDHSMRLSQYYISTLTMLQMTVM